LAKKECVIDGAAAENDEESFLWSASARIVCLTGRRKIYPIKSTIIATFGYLMHTL
jgi:hypothetical protein